MVSEPRNYLMSWMEVILNFMIPPTRVGRLSADTLPTPTISSFFTVIYTALKSPIHSFAFPYDIHNRAESIQYTNEYDGDGCEISHGTSRYPCKSERIAQAASLFFHGWDFFKNGKQPPTLGRH